MLHNFQADGQTYWTLLVYVKNKQTKTNRRIKVTNRIIDARESIGKLDNK